MSASCTSTRRWFPDYLAGHGTHHQHIRHHLAACHLCRRAWNRYRWDAAATHPTYNELRDFLGDDFTPYLDSSTRLADEWDRANPTSPGEIAAFYRHSTAYLYNLAIWQASGHRPNYPAAIPLLQAAHVTTICDYGCGIGNDTLRLLDAGFTVICCDYDSPSTAFLRWRLQRRGRTPPLIIEPDQLHGIDHLDALWVIDTLDHLPDIDTAMGRLLDQVRIAITEDLTLQRGTVTKRFHHHRNPEEIAATFASHGLHPTSSAETDPPITLWARGRGLRISSLKGP